MEIIHLGSVVYILYRLVTIHAFLVMQAVSDMRLLQMFLLHTLEEKRDKHTIHNNPTATWHASFIPPPPHPPTYPEPPTTWFLPSPLVRPAPVRTPTGYKIPCFLSHLIHYTQPLKMELTQGSETSANYNLAPRKYPKEHIQYSNHGESLKSRNVSSHLHFNLFRNQM